jgi:predicted anti-sigma-YlaC factor YlaD
VRNIRSHACERARTWVSLSLDGELSELERRLLDAHLVRCAGCSSFAAEIEGVVGQLRSAPLEPATGTLASVTWRRRQVTPAVRVAGRIGAVAAAAAAGIAMFSLGAGSVGDVKAGGTTLPPLIVDATTSDTAAEVSQFRQMRRATLLSVGSQQDRSNHTGAAPL